MRPFFYVLLVCATTGAALSLPRECRAGSFTIPEYVSADSIMHPSGYIGNGGPLVVTVCIDPASQYASQMVPSVQNIVAAFNAMKPATGNLGSGQIGGDQVDFESVTLHEVGHCIGLAHPNLANESGLQGAAQDYTRARKGPNNAYNLNDGIDNVIGSADDLRGDDVNLHWFRRANNNPFTIDPVVDFTTYSIDLADLPAGHNFAANGSRDVAGVLGLPPTEAVMQQLTYFGETQRSLTHDDIATLQLAMTGLDRLRGTSDDYTLELQYAGMSTSCDVVVSFSTDASLAHCQIGLTEITDGHWRITTGKVRISPNYNWYFNSLATPTATATSTSTSSPTRTDTPTPTATPSTTPTPSSTPTSTATSSATPSHTPTEVPSSTQTPTPTESPSPSPTHSATATPTATATPSATATPTGTASATTTPTATATSTATASPSPSSTPSFTATVTPAATPTPVALSGTILQFGTSAPFVGAVVQSVANPPLTDSNGHFSLQASPEAPLAVVPESTTPASATIDVLDAVRALQLSAHGDLAAADRYACDASGNGVVTALDAALLLRFLVGAEPALPVATRCGSEWLFLPTVATTEPGLPLAPEVTADACSPGAIVHNPLVAGSSGQDFIAIPLGDCDGSGLPQQTSDESLFDPPAVVAGPLHGRLRSLRYPVALPAGMALTGLEATILYDPDLLAVRDVRRVGEARAMLYADNDVRGELRIALAAADPIVTSEGPLFVVHFAPLARNAADAGVHLSRCTLGASPAPVRER